MSVRFQPVEPKPTKKAPIAGSPSRKVAISIRLDADILERFKATGPGWQTRINEALKGWRAK